VDVAGIRFASLPDGVTGRVNQTPPHTGASVNVIVGAKSQSETHTGDLHL
jgi:hypothetical protein